MNGSRFSCYDLAPELLPGGIRINAVCPGAIRTAVLERELAIRPTAEAEWISAHPPLGRLDQREEVSQAVVWLCSGAASLVIGHASSVTRR